MPLRSISADANTASGSSFGYYEGSACGIGQGGITYCWGIAENGKLGDGRVTSTTQVVRVVGQ